MKIAIPASEGKLCMHFGHCEQFMICDVDKSKKCITSTTFVTPPPHEPGVLPGWIAEKGVKMVIAGIIDAVCILTKGEDGKPVIMATG